MANTFTDIVDKIFARGLMALRENAVMPRLVNTDWANEIAQQGDTIDVPIPSAFEVGDVTPGPTPPAGEDHTPTTVQISLDQWKKVDMHVTDKEAREIAVGARSLQLSEALKALANNVDRALLDLHVDIYGYSGTPGTNPFASDLSEAITARKALADQLAPPDPRAMVLDPGAVAEALGLAAIQDASRKRAGEDTLVSGEIGRILGFLWAENQNVRSFTNGSLTDGSGHAALVNGAPTLGDKTADFDETSLTGDVHKGEVFTVAGDPQTYVVTADATASGNAITLAFEPGVQVVWADNAQMTLKGDADEEYVNNLAFHRDAFALATRPLAPADAFTGGHEFRQAVDPVSGLALSLEISREYKRTKYEWSILYGVKTARRELAARVAGA